MGDQSPMIERIFRRLLIIGERDKLIGVKSWCPRRDPAGWGWPLMLVDTHGYQRATVLPIWDCVRVRLTFLATIQSARRGDLR